MISREYTRSRTLDMAYVRHPVADTTEWYAVCAFGHSKKGVKCCRAQKMKKEKGKKKRCARYGTLTSRDVNVTSENAGPLMR